MKLAAALALLCFLAGGPDAFAAKAAISADVPASSWKTVRLRGLAKDGSLAVRVEASGPINILLIHEQELRRFPKPVQPAFAGSLERRLAFKVRVPVAGTYYVILDNRKGVEARTIKLFIEALKPRPPRSVAPAKPRNHEDGKAI